MSRFFFWLAGVAAAAMFSACAPSSIRLYEGPGAGVQEARITLPEQLEVLSVNGAEVKGASGLLTKGDKTLAVAPGRYELLVYYREVWELGSEHDVLRSDPALFVVDARPSGRYRIDYARPRRYEDAQRLAKAFSGWVVDGGSGARTPSQDSKLSFREGWVAAFTGDNSLVETSTRNDGSQVVEPLATAVLAGSGSDAAPSGADATLHVPSDASRQADAEWLPMMKAWWAQASTEERREFLRWVGEQSR